MYDVLPTSVATCPCLAEGDTTVACSESEPTSLWLFTDPAARVAYAFEQRLDILREDITGNVTIDGRWAPDELALKREYGRLLGEGRIIPKGTFGYVSPHPTVYRAVAEDAVCIAGAQYSFQAGDDLVFVPWLLRASCAGHTAPVRIGRLHSVGHLCLSCEAFPATRHLCGRSRAILYHALYPDYQVEGPIRDPYRRSGKNGAQPGGTMLVKDPVCGMQIDSQAAAAQSIYQGQTYYFCTSYCKRKFELDPTRYVQKDSENQEQEE